MTNIETRSPITLDNLSSLDSGDLVVMTKGESVLRETVVKVAGNYLLALDTRLPRPRLRVFLDAGYTVEKITVTPATPTTPGHYLDKAGRHWFLTTTRRWIAWDGGSFDAARADRLYGPFSPVPEPLNTTTPEEVIDADGDTWKRTLTGEYNYRHITKPLAKVRDDHGPLHLPGATV